MSEVTSFNINGQEYDVSAECNDISVKYGTTADLDISDENGYVVARFEGGHIQTQNFNSKNSTNSTVNNYKPRPSSGKDVFTVSVNIAVIGQDNSSLGVNDEYIEGTDHGYIALPTNYDQDGEPTRLIIACHGAGGSLSTYTDSNSGASSTFTFWLNLGYAIMDMFACPYKLSGTNDDNGHFGNPSVVPCYKKGYDYVMKNYNLKRDGIFVVGGSMGGISSFEIVQSGLFPVLANIGYCPAIELFKQIYCNPWTTASTQRSSIAKYFGFTGTEPTYSTSKPPSDDEIQYFKDNFDKVIGHYPMLKNVTSGDITKVFDYIPSPIGVNNTPEEEQAFYDTLISWHPCPVKIFHCLNDGTVAYRYSKYFIEMLRRGGQTAYLHTFPSGGHNAWDNGNTTTITDISGASITLSASKYESYLFFKRFEND